MLDTFNLFGDYDDTADCIAETPETLALQTEAAAVGERETLRGIQTGHYLRALLGGTHADMRSLYMSVKEENAHLAAFYMARRTLNAYCQSRRDDEQSHEACLSALRRYVNLAASAVEAGDLPLLLLDFVSHRDLPFFSGKDTETMTASWTPKERAWYAFLDATSLSVTRQRRGLAKAKRPSTIAKHRKQMLDELLANLRERGTALGLTDDDIAEQINVAAEAGSWLIGANLLYHRDKGWEQSSEVQAFIHSLQSVASDADSTNLALASYKLTSSSPDEPGVPVAEAVRSTLGTLGRTDNVLQVALAMNALVTLFTPPESDWQDEKKPRPSTFMRHNASASGKMTLVLERNAGASVDIALSEPLNRAIAGLKAHTLALLKDTLAAYTQSASPDNLQHHIRMFRDEGVLWLLGTLIDGAIVTEEQSRSNHNLLGGGVFETVWWYAKHPEQAEHLAVSALTASLVSSPPASGAWAMYETVLAYYPLFLHAAPHAFEDWLRGEARTGLKNILALEHHKSVERQGYTDDQMYGRPELRIGDIAPPPLPTTMYKLVGAWKRAMRIIEDESADANARREARYVFAKAVIQQLGTGHILRAALGLISSDDADVDGGHLRETSEMIATAALGRHLPTSINAAIALNDVYTALAAGGADDENTAKKAQAVAETVKRTIVRGIEDGRLREVIAFASYLQPQLWPDNLPEIAQQVQPHDLFGYGAVGDMNVWHRQEYADAAVGYTSADAYPLFRDLPAPQRVAVKRMLFLKAYETVIGRQISNKEQSAYSNHALPVRGEYTSRITPMQFTAQTLDIIGELIAGGHVANLDKFTALLKRPGKQGDESPAAIHQIADWLEDNPEEAASAIRTLIHRTTTCRDQARAVALARLLKSLTNLKQAENPSPARLAAYRAAASALREMSPGQYNHALNTIGAAARSLAGYLRDLHDGKWDDQADKLEKQSQSAN